MVIRDFPGLGFDPAPGDPAALSTAGTAAGRAGQQFADGASTLSRLSSGDWTGQAADAFRGQLARLPTDLNSAAHAHTEAAHALADYSATLNAMQVRAGQLEAQAVQLRAEQTAAINAVNRIATQQAPTGSAALADLQAAYRSARSTADSYGSSLDDVLRAARRLADDHAHAARAATRRIRAVLDTPYKEPSWLQKAWNATPGRIKDHADVLHNISAALKIASAVLGLLSLIPGLQFLAPIAMAAAGIALGSDIVLKLVTGQGSWTSIGIDAALTFMPWGRVAKLARELPVLGRALDAAGDALSAGKNSLGGLLRGGDTALTDVAKLADNSGGAVNFATKAMNPRYVGEHLPGNSVWPGRTVEYLDDAGRARLKLTIDNGLLRDAEGELFDTTTSMIHTGMTGRSIFVMDEEGNLYASLEQSVGRFHHSSMLAGRPVAGAGELEVHEGVLRLITNNSGHYAPTREMVAQVVDRLRRAGINLTDDQIYINPLTN